MDVNRDVIEGKIDVIERNLNFLEQYKDIKIKEFENSYKDVASGVKPKTSSSVGIPVLSPSSSCSLTSFSAAS